MKLINEDQIKDIEFRKKVIAEIKGSENIRRKNSELKKNEIYKDQTRKWVIEALMREGLKPNTLMQMANRAANVSVCRKIVDKLSRTYLGGVQRTTDVEGENDKVEELANELCINDKLKKADRYLQLHKNCMIQVVPELDTDTGKYCLRVKPLAPFNYDVLEDYINREKPKVVILTDFVERTQFNNAYLGSPDVGVDGTRVTPNIAENTVPQPDRTDQTIANSPEDKGQYKRTFIWWSNTYHFTTDDSGAVIEGLSPEDGLNPIGMLPFVNIAEDQDGDFWAQGGSDLVDGSILINKLLTDMYSIAAVQGWGQMVITGKNVPRYIEGGPHNALVIDYDQGDPEPKVSFESASPPLDVWMKMIEQYAALLLSTNNLSPRSVAAQLNVQDAASGIALMIEQSDSTADVQEKQKVFKHAEDEIWELVKEWINLYNETDELEDSLQEIGKLTYTEVETKFMEVKPVLSEKEKLDNIKLRQDLGINTAVELIQTDNPDLTEKQAEEKLLKIQEEKLQRVHEAMNQVDSNHATVNQVDANPDVTVNDSNQMQ